METADRIRYWTWCQDKYWQYQRRQEWSYGWRGDTLIRYHELAMPDPEFMKGLLEWLKLPESVHGFEEDGQTYGGCTMYNRQAELDGDWKPVSAWYEQQEGQIDERTKLKVIRVFQALQRNPKDGEGDGPYVVENGCMYRISHEYFWNVAELPETPQGESGVGYRLGSVAKDDETGLWSCYLEKRERMQQEVPEYTSDNTDFTARTERQFLGVRQESVPTTGKEASSGGGVTVRRRVKKNEDCTSDVTVETVVDKPVDNVVETVEKTLRGRRRTVESRNMKEPLGTENLPVGTKVRNEKTESGLWNLQKVESDNADAGELSRTIQESELKRVEQTSEAVAEMPQLEVESNRGVIARKGRRANEEGGWDFESSKDEAKPSDAEKTWTTEDDSYSYKHGVHVYRNQSEVPTPPTGKYRCSMSLSINEYGLYDAIVTWSERTALGDGGNAGLINTGKETKWIHYYKGNEVYKRPVTADFTVRIETGNNLHTIMLDGAESGFGFQSRDNGRTGVKYTNIQVGAEEKAT